MRSMWVVVIRLGYTVLVVEKHQADADGPNRKRKETLQVVFSYRGAVLRVELAVEAESIWKSFAGTKI